MSSTSESSDLSEKWQQETKLLKHLPYYNKLTIEADKWLSAIKAGLGRSILLREIPTGVKFWMNQLRTYTVAHRLRFSKVDHVNFIKVFFGIVLHQRDDADIVEMSCSLLVVLLEKRFLLTKEDLHFDWKELYDFFQHFFPENADRAKYFKYNNSLLCKVRKLVSACSAYFPDSSVEEILIEFRPKLYPLGTTYEYAVCALRYLIPKVMSPQVAERYGQILIDELLDLWKNYPITKVTQQCILTIICDIVVVNAASLNFDHHLDFIFTKVLRNFNLPIVDTRSSSRIRLRGKKDSPVDAGRMATLIAYIINTNNDVLNRLQKLVHAIFPHCHPSNDDRCQIRIFIFLDRLSKKFCYRYRFERLKKVWYAWTPEHMKLSEKHVKSFVSILLPCVINGMFLKSGVTIVARTIQRLSALKPKMVVPSIIDQCQISTSCIAEPNRFYQSLTCLAHSTIGLMNSSEASFFCLQLVPILRAAIENIEAKNVKSFHSIALALSTCFILARPAVIEADKLDTSSLSEKDKQLCSAAAIYAELYPELFDRVLILINAFDGEVTLGLNESFSEETTKKTLQSLFAMVVSALSACTTEVFQRFANSFVNFIRCNIQHSRLSHKLATGICYIFCELKPDLCFYQFYRVINSRLMRAIEDGAGERQEVASSFLNDIEMLTEIFKTSKDQLVQFEEEVLQTLAKLHSVKAKNATTAFGDVLHALFRSLCNASVGELVIEDDNDEANSQANNVHEIVAFKFGVKRFDNEKMHVNWSNPNEKHIGMAIRVLNEYLTSALHFVRSAEKQTRVDLEKALFIIKSCLCSANGILGPLRGEKLPIETDIFVPDENYFACSLERTFEVPDHLHNVSNEIRTALARLTKYLLGDRETEICNLVAIVETYAALLLPKTTFENVSLFHRWFGVRYVKHLLHNPKWTRFNQTAYVFVDDLKILHANYPHRFQPCLSLNVEHLEVVKDLLKLTFSHSPLVLGSAIYWLKQFFDLYGLQRQALLEIVQSLTLCKGDDKNIFKGALVGVGLCQKVSNTKTLDFVERIWSQLLACPDPTPHNDVKFLFNEIRNDIIENSQSFTLTYKVPESVVQLVAAFWSQDEDVAPHPCVEMPAQWEIEASSKKFHESNILIEVQFKRFLDHLIDIAKQKDMLSLHGRMAQAMLYVLMRSSYKFSSNYVAFFVKLLLERDENIRSMATRVVYNILKEVIGQPNMVELELPETAKWADCLAAQPDRFCIRSDNLISLCDVDKLPKSDQEWNSTVFIGNSTAGIYYWPRNCKGYAPIVQQPNCEREPEQMGEDERAIYDAFNATTFVDEFCSIRSMDSGSMETVERINGLSVNMLVGLFCNFGSKMWQIFKPYVERLVENDRPGSHRLAAEILSALITGMQFWLHENQKPCQTWVVSMLQIGLDKATIYTSSCWSDALEWSVQNYDPRSIHWLIDYLVNRFLSPCGSVDQKICDGTIVHNVLQQFAWRISAINCKLLEYLKNNLVEDYHVICCSRAKLINFILSSCNVANKVEVDFQLPDTGCFVKFLLSQLKEVENVEGEKDKLDSLKKLNEQQNVSIVRTSLFLFADLYTSNGHKLILETLGILKVACVYENRTMDNNLKALCKEFLRKSLPQCYVTAEQVPTILQCCDGILQNNEWTLRVCVVNFLQLIIYCNVFAFGREEYVGRVSALLMGLLIDESLEVRKSASKAFSSFFRYNYMEAGDKEYLKQFQVHLKSDNSSTKHGGILGLVSIVNSHPYTIPPYLPNVLMILCRYAHDKSFLISTTVKTALCDFKRTHVDAWREHEEKFTDEQLATLADIVISPSYYV